jgi:hypothetical protein
MPTQPMEIHSLKCPPITLYNFFGEGVYVLFMYLLEHSHPQQIICFPGMVKLGLDLGLEGFRV